MKKRVLLIDDEARVRASLKAVLEPTYETIQAADAQEGLELFRKEAPHLVLLDVILPGTDGLSVLQTMRAENRTAPVIMLTGTKSVKTAVDAMKFGVPSMTRNSNRKSNNSVHKSFGDTPSTI